MNLIGPNTWNNSILILTQPVIIKCISVINLHPDQYMHRTNLDLRDFCDFVRTIYKKGQLNLARVKNHFTPIKFICGMRGIYLFSLTLLYSKPITRILLNKKYIHALHTSYYWYSMIWSHETSENMCTKWKDTFVTCHPISTNNFPISKNTQSKNK